MDIMTIEQYKAEIKQFAAYKEPDYPAYLLVEEIGEYFGKIAKSKRGDVIENLTDAKLKELGDICWAAAEMCNVMGISISESEKLTPYFQGVIFRILEHAAYVATDMFIPESKGISKLFMIEIFQWIEYEARNLGSTLCAVMEMNITKLHDRKNRGVISGTGDNR
jgi:NTP pyrophosphatase (non-canonical NTP hydrolase)